MELTPVSRQSIWTSIAYLTLRTHIKRKLCTNNNNIRLAVGIRLALNLCVPRQCRCGSQVDSFVRHSLVCKRAPGRTVRHHHFNDVIARSLASAGVPVSKEPSGLCRSGGKRPDGSTLIPRRADRSLIWDVTVSCTTADFYLEASSREAGAGFFSDLHRRSYITLALIYNCAT